jgi:GTP-binding protein LepA
MCLPKTGAGVEKLLDEVIVRVPQPPENSNQPLRALIFDFFMMIIAE